MTILESYELIDMLLKHALAAPLEEEERALTAKSFQEALTAIDLALTGATFERSSSEIAAIEGFLESKGTWEAYLSDQRSRIRFQIGTTEQIKLLKASSSAAVVEKWNEEIIKYLECQKLGRYIIENIFP